MIYADGTALSRFLPGVACYEDWMRWAIPQLGDITTTQLGLTEVRQIVELYPREQKAEAYEIVKKIKTHVPVMRISDENVQVSSHAAAVLQPFAAIHLGAAVAHPKVDTIATYDIELARAAVLYELKVVTPGMPDGWHNGVAGAS
ncbi:MAG: hypothetical protein DIU73_000210 [Actinomycetes bacterium]|nr:MAG: hypothetical protein DIU73_02345 [Actinomycetota bacterium]